MNRLRKVVLMHCFREVDAMKLVLSVIQAGVTLGIANPPSVTEKCLL